MGTLHWPGVLAIVLFAAVVNTDASARSCRAVGCSKPGGNGLFKYEAGHTYIYNLDGHSLADLPEQQGDGVKIGLKAVAEVHFGAACINTLKLKDVQVTGPNAKKYGNLKDLEAHAVQFTFTDGQVEPELCVNDDDTNTALNIKRAIISLLQVSTPQSVGSASKHETDVFGSCPTSFVFNNNGPETHVSKSRNLNKCSHREDLRHRVMSSSYDSKSEHQSSPLLDANLAVDMVIKAGIVESAESRETYLYRPFANKEIGRKTVIVTKLTLASQSAGAPHTVGGSTPKSLIFDTPHGDTVTKSNSAAVVAAMHEAKTAMPDSAGAEAATEFRHLVEVVRHTGKDDLLTVYGQVKAGAGFADKKSARTLFLHALFRARTGDSVEVAVELIKSKEIDEDKLKLWFANFGFMRHTTLASLTAASSLLDVPNMPRNAYLGVGSLAGIYCQEHECHDVKEVNQLLARLAKPLAKGCKCSNHEEENAILVALKGLENVKQLNEATAELLRVCASDIAVPARVRVAALETFRADACQPQLRKTAAEILLNRQEDSEIRIKSYLALVQCPNGKSANNLKEMLDSEPVNQVGSFIVSHLRNLRASTNPDKALAKYHLSEVRTTKRFPIDVRRYSHNRELSYFFDGINAGASWERNVIYSQQSYLPRSTSLNLTTELFGHSFNVLELGSRAENLDRIVEKYFGPKGVFKTTDLEDLLTNGKANLKHLREKIQERMKKAFRSKRSVPIGELDAFRNQVALLNDHKDIDLDLNVKLFGSNVGSLNYHGDAHELSPERLIDRVFDRIDGRIEKLKDFDLDIKQHGIFFERELDYPTGLGFPLKLAVSASVAVHLKTSGKIDIPSILKDPKNAHFQFEVIPSASVELLSEMTIDAHAVEAGTKVSIITHSATGVNVNIKAVDGAGFDVSIGLPVKKQDIINIKSEVLSSVQENGQAPVETPIAFNVKRKDYHGCFDQLSKLIGLTFCGTAGIPFDGLTSKAALFPLNGPGKLQFTIESDDVTTYKFRGVAKLNDPEHKSLQLLIDTPNSKENRKVEILLERNLTPIRQLKASLISPYKLASAELVLVDNENEQSLTGKLVNDNDEYVAKIGADISGSEAHRTYTPVFEYSTPNTKTGKKGKKAKGEYGVQGSVLVDKDGDSRKYTFNNIVIHSPAGPVSLNGWIARDKTSFSSDLKVGKDKDTLNVKSKLERPGPSQFKVDVEVQASNNPDMGVSVKWDYNRGKDQLDSNLVLVHGKDLNNPETTLTAITHAKYHWVDRKDFDFIGNGKVSYPFLGIDGKIAGNASPKGIGYDLDGTYDKYKVKSVLSAKRAIKTPGDYAVEFEAKVLDSSIKFETKRDILSPIESKFATVLELTPGGKYELHADVTCQHEPNNVLQKVVAVANIAGQPHPFKLDAGLEVTGQVFEAHTKASVGSVDHVDISAKVNKAPNPSGNFKLLLKDRIDGTGQFKFQNGVGSLAATIDLKKTNRKIKASGDIAITGTNHVGNFDLYLDHDKDQNKKIHISTATDIQKGSIDSKNTVIIFEYKTELNFKAEGTGKPTDGHIKAEADLTLPCGRVITAKVDRELHVHTGNTNFDYKLNLGTTPKGGAPTTVAIESKGEKIDFRHGIFDTDFNFVYKNAAGKDVNYHVLAKSLPNGENRNIEFKGLVKGSLLELTPLIHVTVDVAKPVYKYTVKLNLDTDSNMLLTGQCTHSEGQKIPSEVTNNIELNLPTGELKHISGEETWSFTRGLDGAPSSLKGFVTVTINKEKTTKVSLELQGTKEGGSGKVVVTGPKNEPRSLEGSFKVDKTVGIVRDGSLTYKFQDKESHVEWKIAQLETKDGHHITITGRSPLEKLRTFSVDFKGKRTEVVIITETTVIINDKKSVINTKYGLDKRHPIVEFGIVHPGGRTFFGFFLNRRESRDDEFSGELNAEHAGQTLAVKVQARVPSANDFDIKIDLDSTRMKWNKLHIVLANKPGVKGGKALTITVTEEGKSIVDGKLDFSHVEDNGHKYEATGNLNVRGENKAARIVLKRNVIATDNENGIEASFSVSLGDGSSELVYKRTNKEFHSGAKLCKAKDSCGHADYHIVFNINGFDIERDATIDVDLTGLGRPTNFGLKSHTERKEKHFLHAVEVHSKTKDIYKYKIDVTDKAASFVATSPHREVALEASFDLNFDPANRQHVSYKLEANAWLDRVKEPAQKATFLVDNDWLRTDDSITITTSSKFQHPSLGKDMVVKGKSVIGGRQIFDSNVEIDIFAKRGQRINIEAKILKNSMADGYNFTSVWDVKSKGQNLDIVLESHVAASSSVVGAGATLVYKDDKTNKDLGFGYQRTANKISLFVKSPKDILLNVEASCKLNDNFPAVHAHVEAIGLKAIIYEAHFEKNKFVYSLYKKETPERKVQGLYQVDLSTKAIAKSEWVQGAETKELYNVVVSWGKTTAPEINYSLDNVKELLEFMRKDVAHCVEKVKEASKSMSEGAATEANEILDGMKKAQPNLKPLLQRVQGQIKVIREELQSDETIKELTGFIRQLIGTATESLAHVTEVVSKIAEKALDFFENTSSAVLTSLKRIVPAITESLNKIFQTSIDLSNNLVNRLLVGLQNLVELIKKHEAEFKEIVTGVAEITRDVFGFVGRTVHQLWHELRDFLAILSDQLKALPMYSMIQERLQEWRQQLKDWRPPEQLLATVHEIRDGLKDSLPTEELKEFVTAISDYIDKVLVKKQDVDDVAELKSIVRKFCDAVKSVIKLIKTEVGAKDGEGALKSAWPLSLRNIYRLPVWSNIHLSPIAFLRSDDRPTLRELFYAYRPSWNPLDSIPPFNSYAIIIDTSHFFTLDHRHFTFQGSCSYILAQDVVNGNFTIVLNLDNGKFKSLQISDHKDTIEASLTKGLLVNGAPHEYPANSGDLHAWRRYNSINLKSDSGVHIKIDQDHHFAVFDVSGFYHGQIRGLLGNLNNEPFDDFRLPNGKVTDDIAEFGNAYAVGAKCAPGSASEHHAHHAEHSQECSNLFSANSPLRAAFPVVNPSAFREGCDHYVTETADKKTEYACRIAAAYVNAAHEHGLHIQVPDYCAQCKSGDKVIPVGETVTVKSGKAADIVFVVEQVTANAEVYKELVGPLVASLQKDLKEKGISDVDITLLTYGHPDIKWPQHHTTNGKLTFDGKAVLEFGEAEHIPTTSTTCQDKWNRFKHRVQVETGRVKGRAAMVEVSKYPFRAGAAKTIILVKALPCEKSHLPLGGFQRLRMIIAEKIMRDRGITFHTVTALDAFNVAGNKEGKKVVGFDKDSVYSLSDSKKKVLEGNDDLRDDIEYGSDVCVDSTQRTNGAAFVANNFLEGKAGQRKQFLSVVSHRIVDSLTDEWTEECTCAIDHGVHARATCTVTSRKESEQLSVKGKKGSKN